MVMVVAEAWGRLTQILRVTMLTSMEGLGPASALSFTGFELWRSVLMRLA